MALPIVKDSLQNYMVQISQFPLLTREEEFSLAVKVRKYNDLDSAHKLTTSNLRFVLKIAFEYRKYVSSYIKLSDLVQEGNIGLMKAVKKFDPYKGFKLITYAVWWIRAQIQSFILKTLSVVKRTGTGLKKKLSHQLAMINNKIDALGNSQEENSESHEHETYGINYPTAETTNFNPIKSLVSWQPGGQILPKSESYNNHNSDHSDISLDSNAGQLGPNALLDHLPDPSTCEMESHLSEKEEQYLVKTKINSALSSLKSRERYVIEKRFIDEPPLTLQELGDHLGISRERVRQIENAAIKKLKITIQEDQSLT